MIILTSRLHPDGRAPSPTQLRSEIATLAAAAVVDAPLCTSPPGSAPTAEIDSSARCTAEGRADQVQCGIDVLVEEGFRPVQGLKLGLVTNHTGRTRDGKSTIDVLFHAPGVKLVRLFSPEHGIRGEVDAAVVDDCRPGDRPTGQEPLRQGQEAATARPRGPGRARLRHPGRRGAILHVHHHARPRARSGRGSRQEGTGARPSQPDRRAHRRARFGTRSSARSSPITPYRSGTG